MPVVVTGASGPVGRALVPRLVAAGSEVRAVVARQAAADRLRELGAKVAVGDSANPELLPAVLRDAHTLCLVVDGLFLEEEDYFPVIAGTTQATVEAAREAGVKRLILLSYPGADPGSPNAYLRAKGTSEEVVRESGVEHAVVRSTLVVADGARWPMMLRRGGQRLAPVYVEDLAAVLASADDRAEPVSGTFALQGPDTVIAEELIGLVRRDSRLRLTLRKAHMSPAAAEILSSDSVADAPDAAAEFGVKLTPLGEALQASGLTAA